MLRGIRNVTSNRVGKWIMSLLFGVLIISFAVWGIADIFKGSTQTTLATVGNTEISMEQFRTAYTDKLQQISRQIRRPINANQGRAFGLDRQLLQQTIAEAALDEETRRLGLTMSDAEMIRTISGDPTFAGPDGKFDARRFAAAIRDNGYTEQRYVAEQRRVTLRRELVSSIVAGLEPSKTQIEALSRFQNEQRTIDYAKIGPEQAGTIETPSQQVLDTYYDEHKAQFRAPEYRKVVYLTLSPDELAKKVAVSDEDARKVYDSRRDEYATPAKREVLQIAFPSEDAAKTAREKIAGGTSFEDLAKEMKLTPGDINLGLTSEASLGDPTIAKAAFALPLNEVSQPVKGALATVLLKITKIEPGSQSTYESVAPAIKKEIAEQRVRADFDNLRNTIEDERSGGATIPEAGQKVGLDAVTVDIDRAGRTPDGKEAALPKGVDLVTAAFGSDVGVENDPLTFPGGEVWFDVLGVTASRDRTLDEVKDQVATRWREDQVATRLRAKAKDLVEAINKGGAFKTEATKAGLSAQTSSPFKRDDKVNGLPDQAVDVAFRTPKDTAATADNGAAGNGLVVLKVVNVTTPTVDLESEDSKKMKEALEQNLSDEQIGQYITHLEAKAGVQVNQNAFAIATGAASSQ
ncbi:peptidylprolyl isomerase [Afipia carboxidovorans]|uniref:peptidylprolyl isomerase n=1 Tax=Afipia carboxidovorans TaxID=40137 RepID=UPI0030847946|nr:SurA N-terminal domain-containing protein [Afipia carboxidovorans]